MKKSWFHYFKEIIAFTIIAPIGSFILFYFFLKYLKTKNHDSVLLKIIEGFNNNTVSSVIGILVFSVLISCCYILALKIGYERKLISQEKYHRYSENILKIGFTIFVMLTCSISLNELQFFFFSGLISFYALIKEIIFNKNK